MVRDEFNKTKKPDDFYYLLRMAINGLVRFNSKGEFNSPTDYRRKGMQTKTVKQIINQWSKLVQKVEFVCQSYDRIFPGKKDFVYMDPPYSQSDGMYTGNIDLPKYFDWVRQLPCKYGISLNGLNMAEANNNDILPSDLYDQRFLLGSGISNFQLIHGKKVKVFEYFYLKSEGYKHRLKIRDLTQFMTTEKSLGNPNQL
jgi:DNA adenine methylase